MERVFDFLSRYDIVSSMIPGMVFCQMLDWIYGMNLMEQRPAAVVVTVYLSGLALGRVSLFNKRDNDTTSEWNASERGLVSC